MWRSVIENSAPPSPTTSDGGPAATVEATAGDISSLPMPPPPPTSQISSVTDVDIDDDGEEKYAPPPVRRTNIHVCVRLRPILKGDSASPLVVPRGGGGAGGSSRRELLLRDREREQSSQQLHAGPGGPRPDRHFATPTSSSRRLGSGSRLQPPGSGRSSGLQPPASSSGGGGGRSSSGGSQDRPKSGRKNASSRKLVDGTPETTDGGGNGGDGGASSVATTATMSSLNSGSPPQCAWEVPPPSADKKGSSKKKKKCSTTIFQSPSTDPDPTRKSAYVVDRVFGPGSRTSGLYSESVRDVVRASMEGYHGSVFAYGQTSTGKTYTMTGTPNDPGVVPLAVRDCFRYIQKERSGLDNREYLLRVSYMEIYNEQIYDLLVAAPPSSRSSSSGPVVPPQSNIRIFESKTEGVVVRGLHEEIVTSPEQVFALLAQGEARRRTGSTALNRQSSRSHSIFRLLVESRIRRGPRTSEQMADYGGYETDSLATGVSSAVGAGGPVRVSSLSLVDLAGSESVKATGATGSRQKEGQYINKSLMTLGHVVYKLSELSMLSETPGGLARLSKSRSHIPYRDSKLTRLLQPSLSGNAQICVVCNVSPLVRNLDESHNTLKFATRAKRIKQSAAVTEVVDDKTMLQNYREEIEALKAQLSEANEAHKRAVEEAQAAGAGGSSNGEEKKAENLIAPSAATSIDDDDDLLAESVDPVAAADEDAHVIAAAIKDLEKLILKKKVSSSARKGGRRSSADGGGSARGKGKKGSIFSVSASGIEDILEKEAGAHDDDDDDENLLDDVLMSPVPAPPKTPKPTQAAMETPAKSVGPADLAKTRFATPGGAADDGDGVAEDGGDDDGDGDNEMEEQDQEVLVDELHRIQSVLNAVLKRKATTAPSTPSVAAGDAAFAQLQTPGRDEEVEVLRAKLHEQEVATSMRKADSSFLQSQVEEKESLLADVSKILEAVEKRQMQLEAENSQMKKMLAQRVGEVRSKDLEIQRLRNQLDNMVYVPEKIQEEEEEEDDDDDDELFSSLI